jgi:hypothetical protein
VILVRDALAVLGLVVLLAAGCGGPKARESAETAPGGTDEVAAEEKAVREAEHPLEAMADWERELWQAHVGTWKSHYTVRDAEGNIVDEYDALNEIALDWERNLYSQRNTYTRGEEVEVRRYSASWEGREMVIRGRILEGRARAYDERTIVLNFSKPSLGEETYETIVLTDPTHRGRTMQHYEGAVLKRVTAVFGEVRVSPEPGIDAEGNDLRPPGDRG